jgi:hypothetical protein
VWSAANIGVSKKMIGHHRCNRKCHSLKLIVTQRVRTTTVTATIAKLKTLTLLLKPVSHEIETSLHVTP